MESSATLSAKFTPLQAMLHSVEIITQGLVDLGVLEGSVAENLENETWRQFYMHGLGHYLGLDVHDVARHLH